MSIPELRTDIAQAREEYTALNEEHWIHGKHHPVSGKPEPIYRALSLAVEARVVALAEHITRLERFASCMAVKELLERDCS